MIEHYLECPDSAVPVPKTLTSRIDIDAVESQWQRRIDNGELLMPGDLGYEEAQIRLITRRAEFVQRFGLRDVVGV